MATDDGVEAAIEDMKVALGVELDRDLARQLGIKPNAVSAWRARGAIPSKYLLRFQRVQDEDSADSSKGKFGWLREAYVFTLVDQFSSYLNTGLMSVDVAAVWRGRRLADAYSYFNDMLPAGGDKDRLRESYDELRREILAGSDFMRLMAGHTESEWNPVR